MIVPWTVLYLLKCPFQTMRQDMSERFGHSVDGIEYDFKFLYGCIGPAGETREVPLSY